MINKIDLVIPWVDGHDKKWQAVKAQYDHSFTGDNEINRYRDWDNLRYLFRGIEQNLPWVRKIHFITWGHVPEWLNLEHLKLNWVKHQDYIPQKYLPTFSSHPIEMNIHRINDLAEQFIYLNDDMFFLRPMHDTDFFVDGIPKDCSIESVHQFKQGGIDHIIANDLEIINSVFSKRTQLRRNWYKWFSPKYGRKILRNLYLLPFGRYVGFENPHLPLAYLKKNFFEVWEHNPVMLDKTSMNKIRSISDVNQWLVRYWQFAKGDFVPGNPNQGMFFSIGPDDELIKKAIIGKKYSMICLSDDSTELDFEKESRFIMDCFEKILPDKSSFER